VGVEVALPAAAGAVVDEPPAEVVALQRPAGRLGAGDQGGDPRAALLVVGGLVAGQPGAGRGVAELDVGRAAEGAQVGDRMAAVRAAPGRRPVPGRFRDVIDLAEQAGGRPGARQAGRLFDAGTGLARGREGGPLVAGCPGSGHQLSRSVSGGGICCRKYPARSVKGSSIGSQRCGLTADTLPVLLSSRRCDPCVSYPMPVARQMVL